MYYTGTVDYSVNIEIPPQTNKVYTNEIDVNLKFNISVEKSVDPPPDFNYNITVMNNSVLNNQDIYSKYRATNVLTDFSNQNVGYNPDYNKTFTVVTMGTALKQDPTWVIEVSTEQSGFGKQNMLDDDPYTYWKSGSVGPESVTIDFGQIKTVFGLIINAPETRLTEFTLEKSSDGSNFTTIKQFSGFNQNPDSTSDTVITYTFNLSNVHNTRYIKLSNIMSTGNYAVGISELKFLILDTTSNNYLTNTNLQQIYLDINVNSFNLVVSAPDYEELEVGNLLTANNIDVSNIDVSNIDIKNTLTIASETPTTAGDSLVFDGNKLTWKNAIIDVREYNKNTDITQRGNNAISGNIN